MASSLLVDEDLATLAMFAVRHAADREDRLEFARARSAKADWVSVLPDAEPCRYCDLRWRSFAGSRLDGHATCVVSHDFKIFVGERVRASPRLTYANVAQAIGVTPSIVRAWIRWHMTHYPAFTRTTPRKTSP